MGRIRKVIAWLLPLAGVVALALATGSGAAALVPAGQARCRPAGAHTLAADHVARVYSRDGAVYGCVDAFGPLELGGATVCNLPVGRAGPVRLAGVIVAYGLETCGVDTGSSNVIVADLTTAATLRDVPASTLPLGPESFVSVTALVLRRGGGVGWIAQTSSVVARHGVTYEVHRCDRGKCSLLDAGASIRPSSLRLHGTRMAWRHGSTTRSAPLT